MGIATWLTVVATIFSWRKQPIYTCNLVLLPADAILPLISSKENFHWCFSVNCLEFSFKRDWKEAFGYARKLLKESRWSAVGFWPLYCGKTSLIFRFTLSRSQDYGYEAIVLWSGIIRWTINKNKRMLRTGINTKSHYHG